MTFSIFGLDSNPGGGGSAGPFSRWGVSGEESVQEPLTGPRRISKAPILVPVESGFRGLGLSALRISGSRLCDVSSAHSVP